MMNISELTGRFYLIQVETHQQMAFCISLNLKLSTDRVVGKMTLLNK